MFKTMKYINKIEPKVPQLNIKHKNRYTANEKKQAQIIANHFKKQFEKEKPPSHYLQLTPMKIPFSKEEISVVMNQLKNKESSGKR